MELIIFIVAIALAYHYMVRKPKQRKLDAELQEAEYMDISQKESAKKVIARCHCIYRCCSADCQSKTM